MDAFHENIYDGPLFTIATESGTIRATIYHPFWVLDGLDLGERATPRELDDREDQGLALPGRWVNSHELRCGDLLIGRDGRPRPVLQVAQEPVSGFLTHNLTVDDDHTFAVGADAVLVHNTGGCPDTSNVDVNRAKLLDELARSGVKHTPESVVSIGRAADGRVVFLETGNSRAGLQHIIERHAGDFAARGITEAQIADAVMTAVTRGKVVGQVGSGRNARFVYEFEYLGKTLRIAVGEANNPTFRTSPAEYPRITHGQWGQPL